ncbi:hypothetical protein EJ06DRAFT_285423 [Trichodelitschia bisporula]|uniref:Uncharacterized protein n=1 Tax=Trichodelitschia bisporula TaxID=703511 RepID=A0A6G1I5Q0_9PEZI|nr:hypothetical protein EJ06DRAFT_285423 [Trichodelitschia bisporula]
MLYDLMSRHPYQVHLGRRFDRCERRPIRHSGVIPHFSLDSLLFPLSVMLFERALSLFFWSVAYNGRGHLFTSTWSYLFACISGRLLVVSVRDLHGQPRGYEGGTFASSLLILNVVRGGRVCGIWITTELGHD